MNSGGSAFFRFHCCGMGWIVPILIFTFVLAGMVPLSNANSSEKAAVLDRAQLDQGGPDASNTNPGLYSHLLLNVIFGSVVFVLVLILVYQNKLLREKNQQLDKEQNVYKSIVEDNTEILCRFNPDFTITFANDAYCSFFGKKKEQIIGGKVIDLVPQEDHGLVVQTLSQLSPACPATSLEYQYNLPGKAPHWHHWTIRSLFNDSNDLVEYQATGRDINDLKNAHQALMKTKEEAEDANRAKSEFLARMSHELRTPLNSVIGFASILIKNKAENLSGRDINFLSRILSNGKHLLELINQILDLSKIESGRMDIEEENVHINQLVWEIFEQMEDQVRKKKIELLADIPETIAPVKTDAGKLRQILINLIGNAIKFTDSGSVMVRIAIHPNTHKPVRLDVIDTGPGIPEDRLALIFEPFKQADSSTSRLYGGTGLGLTISKSLCELLGYRIEAESRLKEGSCFRIVMDSHHTVPAAGTVDIEDTGSVPVSYWQKKDGFSVLQDKKVLIIDDEQDARFLLQHTVEEFGCKAIAASSGAQGLELAELHLPDIILLDVLMPEMNGWEFLINLKSDPSLSHIPVIVVSIVASDLKSVSLGLVDLLDKPVNPEKLFEHMHRYLQPHRGCVLILDKNEEDLGMISSILEREHFQVCAAANGNEAKLFLDTELLDLIMYDCASSNPSDTDFLHFVQNDSRYKHLPILLTASDENAISLSVEDIESAGIVYKGNGMEQHLQQVLSKLFE